MRTQANDANEERQLTDMPSAQGRNMALNR